MERCSTLISAMVRCHVNNAQVKGKGMVRKGKVMPSTIRQSVQAIR